MALSTCLFRTSAGGSTPAQPRSRLLSLARGQSGGSADRSFCLARVQGCWLAIHAFAGKERDSGDEGLHGSPNLNTRRSLFVACFLSEIVHPFLFLSSVRVLLRMLVKSVLTSALLALSLGSGAVEASKSNFGRLGKLSRDPLDRAQKAVMAAHQKPSRSESGYRFLNDKTKRE